MKLLSDLCFALFEKLGCFFFSELGYHLAPKGRIPDLILKFISHLFVTHDVKDDNGARAVIKASKDVPSSSLQNPSDPVPDTLQPGRTVNPKSL